MRWWLFRHALADSHDEHLTIQHSCRAVRNPHVVLDQLIDLRSEWRMDWFAIDQRKPCSVASRARNPYLHTKLFLQWLLRRDRVSHLDCDSPAVGDYHTRVG